MTAPDLQDPRAFIGRLHDACRACGAPAPRGPARETHRAALVVGGCPSTRVDERRRLTDAQRRRFLGNRSA